MIEIAEIRELPLHEKLRLMEALWDGITPDEVQLEVPQWHKDLLDDREEAIRAGTAEVIDWETAKQQIRNAVS
jgi:putative addiction module component (TIGR02574 family)